MCLVASGLALSGCVVFTGPITAEQQDVVGKLRVTFTLCASEENDAPDPPEDHPGCPDYGNDALSPFRYGTAGEDYQLMFAMRVPTGTGVPEVISATPGPSPPAAGTILARRSGSYEAAVQAAFPAAPGLHWVGYVSDPYPFDDGAEGVLAQSAPVSVDIELPRNADGSPFVGSLPVRLAAGARLVGDGAALSAERPVVCGANPALINLPSSTICVDSPLPGAIAGNSVNPQISDFGIVAGNATASPGQTVAVPFNVRGAGPLPVGLTASLTATTALAGVSLAPSLPGAQLANGSDTRVTVPVAIPADAAAGTYDVTLTGRLDNGQQRTGVAQLTVRPRPAMPVPPAAPDATKPVLSKLKLAPKKFKAATKRKRKRGANVSYTLSEAAGVRTAVERCSRYAKRKGKGKAKGSVAGSAARKGRRKAAVKRVRCLRWKALKGASSRDGRAGSNRFRFSGRVAGKTLKPGVYRLALTPTDAAGNRGDAERAPFTISK
jgi:hypothetical protein